MKSDIRSNEDVYFLVHAFYERALVDPLIGEYFTKVVKLDFDIHLPKISEFWISVLFGNGNYQGNPIIKHIELHQKKSLGLDEFERWLKLWKQTINAHYSGPIAEAAKQKADTMAQLMLIKIENSQESGFIQ